MRHRLQGLASGDVCPDGSMMMSNITTFRPNATTAG
jgi:hypothetical protein